MSAVQGHKSTMALASFAAGLDPATLPNDVRQKLGWLLLDHLRVCSVRVCRGAIGHAAMWHWSADRLVPRAVLVGDHQSAARNLS